MCCAVGLFCVFDVQFYGLFSFPVCFNGIVFISKALTYFLNFIFVLYWSIVDLQCCVSFRGTAKWFSYAYTYIQHLLIWSTKYWKTYAQKISLSCITSAVSFLPGTTFTRVWTLLPIIFANMCVYVYKCVFRRYLSIEKKIFLFFSSLR